MEQKKKVRLSQIVPFDEQKIKPRKRKPPKMKPSLTITKEQLELKLFKQSIQWSRIVYQAYFFFLGLILLILSIISLHDYTPYQLNFQQLLENWQSDAISDIQIASTNCNQTYPNYEELIKYHWPGTLDSCDCRLDKRLLNSEISTTMLDFFYLGSICNTDQQQDGCKTYNGIPARNFTSWNDGYSGKRKNITSSILAFRICGLRQKGLNFLNNATTQNNSCPKGTKRCGSINDNRFFCVEEGQKCPVTKIGFISTKLAKHTTLEAKEDVALIEQIRKLKKEGQSQLAEEIGGIQHINSLMDLYYLRENGNKFPISQLRISETDGNSSVCWDTNMQFITPNRVEYFLMKEKRTFCELNDQYTLAHKISEFNFMISNNLVNRMEELPLFTIQNQYNWGKKVKLNIEQGYIFTIIIIGIFIAEESICQKQSSKGYKLLIQSLLRNCQQGFQLHTLQQFLVFLALCLA